MKIGIDAISYYVPKTYLPIEVLAKARGIEYAKLNKGLGLEKMAIPDVNEDVATMAANAVMRLFAQNDLNPADIGRMYLGTESALDAAKPTATYVAGMVEHALENRFGKRALKNCDVVDMTFACIGAVDALENALDWVRAEPSRKAIVIAADMAKYDLASTGEYTQGAGAVAVLVTANPRMLALNQTIGVAMNSVSDFFKPRRTFEKSELLGAAAELLGSKLTQADIEQLLESTNHPFWGMPNHEVEVHKEEPVFDGPYSNDCYQERITEALANYKSKEPIKVLERWNKLVFHLPYAFQGRRMIVENWVAWMKDAGRGDELKDALKQLGAQDLDAAAQVKALAKSAVYQSFVHDFIAQGEAASSQIGNMYTASIFMSLLSLLVKAAEADEDLTGKNIGFFAYGSGSKSKVLEAEVQVEWKQALHSMNLFEELDARHALTFEQYEAWHTKKQKTAFVKDEQPRLNNIGEQGVTLGYRYYA
jgi:hydroxymethylglutaryl-CoA synthase